jgi:Zinc carboxypeptidase
VVRRLFVLVLSALVLVVGLAPSASARPRDDLERPEREAAERGRMGAEATVQSRSSSPNGDCPLPTPPVEENIDLPPGLIPYHEVAPRLCEIAAGSDRIRLEVLGQSGGGRDLYLVTVADPEYGNLRADRAFRELLARDPQRAQRVAERNPQLRSVMWVNGSIHGNEWEGVDAAIQLIERLATAEDPETLAVLQENILLFNVVQNPDGRVQGTRQNANGLDLNRDFATRSQSENRAVVEQFRRWVPTGLWDLHGYVDPMLIEPTTAPHNPNYEYDLYIKWALPAGQAMADEVLAVTGLDSDIPFLDYNRGDWDDWPPIFTPQLAQYYGAVTAATLEVPLDQNGAAADDPPAERAERAVINREAHVAAVWGALRYLTQSAQQVMLDQIEILRRGDAGEPPASDPFLEPPERSLGYPSPPGYEATPPGAYVLPVTARGDVDPATVRLVNHLRAYGIEVEVARHRFTAGGTTYPRGSYVVNMDQPLRGLANTLLERGYDLTPVTPQMYDISGWSLGELWGAPIAESDERVRAGRLLRRDVQPDVNISRRAAAYALTIDDPSDIRAINALLDMGVELSRAADGRVIVPATAYADLVKVAEVEGLAAESLRSVPDGVVPLVAPRIAASIYTYEEVLLRDLGFDLTPIEDFTALDPVAYDVLAFSTGPEYADLTAAEQTAVQSFLAAGRGLVGWTREGAAFNVAANALPVEFAFADIDATPNGVGDVINTLNSPVVSSYPETDSSFVFDPLWFPVLGEGVRVDQRYGEGDFFFAGHWIGQEDAAGQPSIVSGNTATGGHGVLFGTDPLFRQHPKKLFGQMAQALYWASPLQP